jgi:hypothetical protein
MDSEKISGELEGTLRKLRAGLLTEERAKVELALLMAMLKAHEQTTLEEKLDRLEAAMEARG